MNLLLLSGVLRRRAELRAHDHWTRSELLGHQAVALATLRSFAVTRSPFYRDLHRGLENAPLDALPIVTKAMLMERFDDVVTDRDVRLTDVLAYLERATPDGTFRDRYRVAVTGGTTGRRGIFLADPAEWRTVLASYSRAYDWAGLKLGPSRRLRMAVVSSRSPSHQSSMVGASVTSPFVPTLRLDAGQPVADIVAALNDFRPDALVGYASILRILAGEEARGSLHIRPDGIFSASEVLTDETRTMIESAFGVRPTNVYAATETAGIASECRLEHLHAYEDLVIAEIVGSDDRPVPAGRFGAKLLVTVLFSRTQPLIRYELSDHIAAADETCPDGLPYRLLAGVEGREEEVLNLAGVMIHPNVFHAVLERLPVAGWQVVETNGSLRVLLAGGASVDRASVRSQALAALAARGARGIDVTIELVDAIPRTALGKAPLIRSERSATAIRVGRRTMTSLSR